MARKGLFSIATFLSAFLLFLIQPLLAKKCLPWFGSSPSVWLSLVLFFQSTLLLGYFYAFLLTKISRPIIQLGIHAGLMALSLLFLPIMPAEHLATMVLPTPVSIMFLLSACIFLPILLLSAASPLLQYWYCHRFETDFPYRYYALSNLGSLLGLFVFPFCLEPNFGLTILMEGWSIGFSVWLVVLAGLLVTFYKNKPLLQITGEYKPLSYQSIILWLILTFLSSAFLLSSTQIMMQDILSFPLLWILPLALYLISFIVTFSYPRLYHRWFWLVLYGSLAAFVLYIPSHHHLILIEQIAIYSLLLFAGCMICHGELIQRKPNKTYLTHFYLMIALGGVLGGIFVDLIAPLFFTEWWDFYLPLTGIFLIGGALAYPYYANGSFSQAGLKWVWICGSIGLELLLFYHVDATQQDMIFHQRNFFGKSEVVEYASDGRLQRSLRHGHILHGQQYLDLPLRLQPTTYFSEQSGLGMALTYQRQAKRSLQIGVIGLGTGTIAALAKKDDTLRFYEIDPDIINVAHQYFYYLTDTQALVDIVVGDARLSLQKALTDHQANQFDVLAIDAFNGDAVPLHLLTLEAVELYLKHLAPNGILAFHISSRYVDLYPALQAAGKRLGLFVHLTHNASEPKKYVSSSEWVLLTRNPQVGIYLYQQDALFFREERMDQVWTDDFNYLLSVIRW